MESNNDPQLRALLKEWRAPETPASLERRVLEGRETWWQFLLRGYIRVPVPVACALVVLLGIGIWESARLAGKVGTCVAVTSVCPVGSKC